MVAAAFSNVELSQNVVNFLLKQSFAPGAEAYSFLVAITTTEPMDQHLQNAARKIATGQTASCAAWRTFLMQGLLRYTHPDTDVREQAASTTRSVARSLYQHLNG